MLFDPMDCDSDAFDYDLDDLPEHVEHIYPSGAFCPEFPRFADYIHWLRYVEPTFE